MRKGITKPYSIDDDVKQYQRPKVSILRPVYFTVGHVKLYAQHCSMDISMKYSTAHSHALTMAVRRLFQFSELQIYTRAFSTCSSLIPRPTEPRVNQKKKK